MLVVVTYMGTKMTRKLMKELLAINASLLYIWERTMRIGVM